VRRARRGYLALVQEHHLVDQRPVELAEETAAFPTHCGCGRPVQVIEDHGCRQCARHCEIRAYRASPQPRLNPTRG
jgi:hypothetical protein